MIWPKNIKTRKPPLLAKLFGRRQIGSDGVYEARSILWRGIFYVTSIRPVGAAGSKLTTLSLCRDCQKLNIYQRRRCMGCNGLGMVAKISGLRPHTIVKEMVG